VAVPTVLRITRLVSKPGMGAMLVERCAAIAVRERALRPDAYVVLQARRLLDGDRTEVVSITEWQDLEHVRSHMPEAAPEDAPPFYQEYADVLDDWKVELYELTWTTATGAVRTDQPAS
jgi:hypothetical protein